MNWLNVGIEIISYFILSVVPCISSRLRFTTWVFLYIRPASLVHVWDPVVLIDEDSLSLWPLQQSQTLLAPLSGCGVVMTEWFCFMFCGDQGHHTSGDCAVFQRACLLTMAKGHHWLSQRKLDHSLWLNPSKSRLFQASGHQGEE